MGNKISAPKLTQEDFDVIAKEIGKAKEDIKEYYEKFLRLFPGGKAPKQDFLKWFPVRFDLLNTSKYIADGSCILNLRLIVQK